jgi:hypothetical protein
MVGAGDAAGKLRVCGSGKERSALSFSGLKKNARIKMPPVFLIKKEAGGPCILILPKGKGGKGRGP